MEGSSLQIIQAVLTSLIGIYALAGAIEGFFFGELNIFFRALLGLSAVFLMYSGLYTDIAGLVIFGAIVLIQRNFHRNAVS